MTGLPEGAPLLPLPAQPEGVPWPTAEWPTGEPPPGPALGRLLDQAFDPDGPIGPSYAVVVVHRGRVVAERYGGELPSFIAPPEPVGPDTRLLSWSMAKSMLHAVVGMAAEDGLLEVAAPAPVPAWSAPGDPRAAITLEDLLTMRDGLEFQEIHEVTAASDVVEMLWGGGKDDTAAFAADRPLAAPPGTRFYYSSGSSNIVSGVVSRALGGEAPYRAYLADRLFGPIGMTTADPTFDGAGTWVASSFLHATARDYARFGLLYLRDGWWDGRRLLPAGWVDHGRTLRSLEEDTGHYYGAHWWVVGDRHGTFRAAGFEGQSITLTPALDLVVVRFGKSPEGSDAARDQWRAAMVEAFA